MHLYVRATDTYQYGLHPLSNNSTLTDFFFFDIVNADNYVLYYTNYVTKVLLFRS